MKKLNGVAAIDVGTTKVCTILAEHHDGGIRVVGVGITPSKGMHKGMVVNIGEAREAIYESVKKAEQACNFKVESAVSFAIISPAPGAYNTPVKPAFVWTPFSGAIGYEVMVAEYPTFLTWVWSQTTTDTVYKSDEALNYSTTYYWRVRGVTGPAPAGKPAPGSAWVTGIFTTEAAPVEPTPPVVIAAPVTLPAPTVITVEKTVPAPIPSYLLWIIIVIGAVLVIALITLIVRTRRVT